ncbi:MAG: hypothetical protein ACFFAZ_13435 [Promethearchaeota archaeon]
MSSWHKAISEREYGNLFSNQYDKCLTIEGACPKCEGVTTNDVPIVIPRPDIRADTNSGSQQEQWTHIHCLECGTEFTFGVFSSFQGNFFRLYQDERIVPEWHFQYRVIDCSHIHDWL